MKNEEYSGISMILLDIEGTTTPIDFVYSTLFGYAKDKLISFLRKNADLENVRKIVSGLKEHYSNLSLTEKDLPDWKGSNYDQDVESAGTFCLWLMNKDSKNGFLKELQGLIWEEGYKEGLLKGQVYPDVIPAIERWTSSGIEVCIYSSGSVLGQKLLFSSTEDGDLTSYIGAFFDTAVGAKIERKSYGRIAKSRGIPEDRILFLSDRETELDAAKESGLNTIMVNRESQMRTTSTKHPVIQSFDDIKVEKRGN